MALGFEELPELLTVEEAARFLRVSRGVGYQMARRFLDTNGAHGLPVLRIGRQLQVPKRQLERLLNGEIALQAQAAQPARPNRRAARRVRTTAESSAQLALLPLDQTERP